jgi:hypothetical protein
MTPTRPFANFSLRAILGPLALVLGGLAIVSCQTDSEDPQPAPSAVYRVSLPELPEAWGKPDRAVLQVGSDSSVWPVADDLRSIPMELDAPPRDTVRLTLWRGGVLVYEVAYLYDNSTTLRQVAPARVHALALEVFERIQPASSHSEFVEAFAALLVANDSLVRDLGFPTKVPTGVDSSEVIREALQQIVARDTSLAVILPSQGPWALGLDSSEVVRRVRTLVRSGAMQADTATLFAPPTPPDTTAPLLRFVSPAPDSVLQSGLVRLDATVEALDPSGVDSVWIGGRMAMRTDSLWTVKGLVLDSADTLVKIEASARDRRGNRTTTNIRLRRVRAIDTTPPVTVPKDSVAPTVVRQDGTRDTTVSESVTEFVASWRVRDGGGLSRVEIQGVPATGTEGVFSRRISLAKGANSLSIVARDSSGNETRDSIVVVRREADPDTGRSPVARGAGPFDSTVADTDSTVRLVWIVSPRATPVTVLVNGVPVPGVDGVHAVTVPLLVGLNHVVLSARDGSGVVWVDSVRIVRSAPAPLPRDTLSPALVRQGGTRDTTVFETVTEFVASWSVRDDGGLSRVEIQGVPANGTEGVFSRRIALTLGTNVLYLVARDSAGNESRDSIVVRRQGRPLDTAWTLLARRPGTLDTSVANAVTSYLVGWKVLTPGTPRSVRIQGQDVAAVDGVYGATIALVVGFNRVRVEIVDSFGRAGADSVLIQRRLPVPDTEGPTVVREPGTRDTTVSNEVREFRASWRVSDPSGLRSVRVLGGTQVSEGDLQTCVATLLEGPNVLKITAVDSAANRRLDSILVWRNGRAEDKSRSYIAREPGTRDTVLDPAYNSVVLSWRVEPTGTAQTVRINGQTVLPSGGVYTTNASMAGSLRKIVIVVQDSLGLVGSDTLIVSRPTVPPKPRDSVPPVVTRQSGTQDTTVDESVAEYSVAWHASDASGLAMVRIVGQFVTPVAGVYRSSAWLVRGVNVLGIVVRDSAGNETKDSIRVTRLGEVVPEPVPQYVLRQPGTQDTSVGHEVAFATVSWKVLKRGTAQTVRINGLVVQGAEGLYSAVVPLEVGTNAIRIHVTDSAGIVGSDTVRILRREAVVFSSSPAPTHVALPARNSPLPMREEEISIAGALTKEQAA